MNKYAKEDNGPVQTQTVQQWLEDARQTRQGLWTSRLQKILARLIFDAAHIRKLEQRVAELEAYIESQRLEAVADMAAK